MVLDSYNTKKNKQDFDKMKKIQENSIQTIRLTQNRTELTFFKHLCSDAMFSDFLLSSFLKEIKATRDKFSVLLLSASPFLTKSWLSPGLTESLLDSGQFAGFGWLAAPLHLWSHSSIFLVWMKISGRKDRMTMWLGEIMIQKDKA